MPSEIVKQHYIALAKLLKIYRSAPLDRDLLEASQHFCKSLYDAAKTYPDLIFAQPQLYKPQLPFIVNLAFNSAVFTCLLAVRNKFDSSVTIQLMCGSLSIYALEQASIEKHYQTVEENEKSQTTSVGQINPRFAQLLKNNKQHIWLCNYLLCTHIHLTRYPRVNMTSPVTNLAYMANRLTLLCIPNKHQQAISFANAIKHLIIKCGQRWYTLLTPLLQYPSVLPIGSYIRLQDSSIHIVLSLTNEGLVTKPLPTKQAVVLPADQTNIQLTLTQQVIQNYPCQQLNGFTRLNQWWGTDLMDYISIKSSHEPITAFAPVLRMQVPPASLLVIQDQLSHIKTNVAMMVKAIENEPSYAHQLQISASASNRNKQPVQSIQHALAMLGFERAKSILLQQSLLLRLNQHYFPLQKALLTFSQFFVFIISELAARTKLISPELASTIAYFLVSRLFTLPSIRSMNHWESSTLPTFKVASLIKLKATENIKNDALALANAWQQNKQILDLLQHYDLVMQKQENKGNVRQLSFLFGLSLTLAKEYYLTETTRCNETTSYVNTGLIELGLSQAELTDMMTHIVTTKNIFCELI
jgi:hypothetical protein